MRLILDNGAFIALERQDRAMWRRFKSALLAGSVPLSHGGVVGQVWRGRGPRQALLAQALAGTEVRAIDGALGRAAGELLARSGGGDVIDAAIVLLADEGDVIVTSDVTDITALAGAAGCDVEIWPT